jgi:hypothetical protein
MLGAVEGELDGRVTEALVDLLECPLGESGGIAMENVKTGSSD